MPRRPIPQKEEKKSGLPSWVIATGIGVLVLVAAVALFMVQTPSSAPTSAGSATTATSRTKGSPEAKVEFVVWSDFQ